MMADMGYGLLMILASIIITKKSGPRASGQMFGLMFSCGISTFIMGALTGRYSSAISCRSWSTSSTPTRRSRRSPALFTPLDDTITIDRRHGARLCQIVTGMAISFVEDQGQIMDAVWEKLTWWVVFAEHRVHGAQRDEHRFVCRTRHGPWSAPGWSAKGFGKGHIRLGLQPCDGLLRRHSFLFRLMTLMLAGSVIASVFNSRDPGERGVSSCSCR